MNLFKTILLLLGTLSLGMGIIGIVVPGLPTTPFILLSAGLYMRSSEKLYKKLLSIKWIGVHIINYQTQKGLTKRTKISAISTMWIMITCSCLIFITSMQVKIVVLLVGLCGTFVMGYLVPTIPDSKK